MPAGSTTICIVNYDLLNAFIHAADSNNTYKQRQVEENNKNYKNEKKKLLSQQIKETLNVTMYNPGLQSPFKQLTIDIALRRRKRDKTTKTQSKPFYFHSNDFQRQ